MQSEQFADRRRPGGPGAAAVEGEMARIDPPRAAPPEPAGRHRRQRILNELGQLRVQVRELSATSSRRLGPELAEREPADRPADASGRPGQAAASEGVLMAATITPGELVERVRRGRRAQRAARPQRPQAPRRRRHARSSPRRRRRRCGRPRRSSCGATRATVCATARRCCSSTASCRAATCSTSCPATASSRRCSTSGFDVYLVDWGVPDELESGNTLETYTDGYIPTIVARGAAPDRQP